MKCIPSLMTAAAAVAVLLTGGAAHASLTAFQTYTGNYAVSTDGWGSATSSSGIISANVPVGATVVAAYLYTSTNNGLGGAGGTLAGTAISYSALSANASQPSLQAGRADVTGILKPLIDGGAGGLYNFNVTENNTVGQDGEALVVVYQLPSPGAVNTIGILDGSSASAGDTTTVNFAQPVDPTASGFGAELRLGIGFSQDGSTTACTGSGQTSTVTGNSTVITRNAGCNDDSVDTFSATGNLITVGGDDDGFSPSLPSVGADHERYNLTPLLTKGSSTLTINTKNDSNDDNIFLGVLQLTGVATINGAPPTGMPEPMSVALVGLALAGLGVQRKFARR